jgi:hypothetical protein
MFSTKQDIDKDELDKYYKELKQYYSLKKKFSDQKEANINKIINLKLPLESKQQMLAKEKIKCVNCSNKGGTQFLEDKDRLRAICGNIDKPCNLNINIKKKSVENVDKLLNEKDELIKQNKSNIMKTKLDFLFNYIPEEDAVEKFDDYKKNLNILQQQQVELIKIYNNIVDNTDNNKFIADKIAELEKFKKDYNENLEIFKSTQQDIYLKNAVEIYVSKIKQLDIDIRESRYKYNYLETDEDKHYLYQKKYDIKDFEIFV